VIEGYKWTNAEARSWHDGKFGPWTVGATLAVDDAEKDGACGRGIHVGRTPAHAISYGRFPGLLFKVKALSPVLGSDDTKWRVARVSVLAEVEKPSWVVETEAFIESIKTVKFFKPRRPPLKAWQHHAAGDAAGAAAWDAAWAAAWAAAGDAAGAAAGDAARAAAGAAAWAAAWAAARDAAWDAAGAAAGDAAWDAAWDAAGDAARDAAGAAAGDAARDAARDAAGAAAWAAALMAQMAVTSDLDFPDAEKHRRHARDRWKVWQMGYGLACDVNGKLFTYGKPALALLERKP
jgi:hypothetical protein